MKMEITFADPTFLWFVLLIPLLAAVHFYSLRYVRQKALRFANYEALEKIVQAKQIVPNNYLLLAMRAATLLGFTLAASGITIHYETIAAQYDFMIALDSSSSMLAQDFHPNRMGAASQALSAWVSSLPPGSKAGLLHFSSQAEVISSPTSNLAQLSRLASGVVAGKSGGTAICEALKAASNELSTSRNPRAVIIVSDGQNNAGCLLEDGVQYANRNNITVFSIGVGSQEGGIVEGLPGVLFRLEEGDLRKVAEGTVGGKYARAQNSQQLSDALAMLDEPGPHRESLPLAIPIMLVSFVFVFIDWGLSVTRYRAIP